MHKNLMLIEKILTRYETMFAGKLDNIEDRVWQLREDLQHINNYVIELDLQKLLDFNDFNFTHDVLQIPIRIDRDKREFRNHFIPRCAKGEQA